MDNFDFSGWATRANLKCSDGRIIRPDAFKHNDGQKVPLVWNHRHGDPSEVLGHALLENRGDGVYAYCKFNDTESGKTAKLLVQHGDVDQLSIYANQLKQQGPNVIHGNIREVSLVLAGANPGAFIDSESIKHGEGSEEEGIIYTGEYISLEHSGLGEYSTEEPKEEEVKDELKHAEEEKMDENKKSEGEKTIADVFDTLNEEQKDVVYFMIGQALEEAGVEDDYEGGNEDMKHNVFDIDERQGNVLTHSDQGTIIEMAKSPSIGSLQHAMEIYAEDNALQHGIDSIETLFPDYQLTNPGAPETLERDQTWVGVVMNKAHKSPISRIRTRQADARAAELRAKGYKKGAQKTLSANLKLLSRTTDPQTVYRKDELHRDDIIDITDFDVVAWIKSEMRMMLDEEIARAILVGDGRLTSDDDHINEANIRPIWKDDDLYTIKTKITVGAAATDDDKAKAVIKAAVKSRKNYKGSGNPVLYTTEDFLTNCLLLEDTQGYRLYKSEQDVATAMRVSRIVTVPVMENLTRTDSESKERTLVGIIVNLNDYNVGADKGGAVNMFDDFDIDYNQQKYLMETRCSGALIKPYSAIALEMVTE